MTKYITTNPLQRTKHMTKLCTYLFALLYMLPSIGLHIDLTYCCGQLEKIDIAHEATSTTTNCCKMSRIQETCDTKVELIVPQKLLEALATETSEIDQPSNVLAPRFGVKNQLLLPRNNRLFYHNTYLSKSPTQAQLQVFLC